LIYTLRRDEMAALRVQGFIRWDWQHFADFADTFQRWLPILDNKINTIAHLERKDLGC
jgi:hypothetical protein